MFKRITIVISQKHWALLCLSPSNEEAVAAPFSATHRGPTGISVESAAAAARNLLKKTPLDKVVQTAAVGHYSSYF